MCVLLFKRWELFWKCNDRDGGDETPYCSRDHRWPYFNSAVQIKQKPQKMVENKNHHFILQVFFWTLQHRPLRCAAASCLSNPGAGRKSFSKGRSLGGGCHAPVTEWKDVAFEPMEFVALPLLVLFHPRPNAVSVDRAAGYTKAASSRANICQR